MSWSSPRDWTVDEIVTEAMMDSHVKDNLAYLKALLDDHDAQHERAGSDEIDGDHLDIDFTPSGYTPATTPAEAANVDDLAAHLYGIDQILAKYLTGNIWIPASAMWPNTTNGCAALAKVEYGTYDVDMEVLAFDKDANEYAQVTIAMPHDYDGGTIIAAVYWTFGAGGSAAQTMDWNVQGRAYANDSALDQSWGTSQSMDDVAILAGDLHIGPDSAAITLAGSPAAKQLVQLRFYRNVGADNLACDALLIGVMLTYTRS